MAARDYKLALDQGYSNARSMRVLNSTKLCISLICDVVDERARSPAAAAQAVRPLRRNRVEVLLDRRVSMAPSCVSAARRLAAGARRFCLCGESVARFRSDGDELAKRRADRLAPSAAKSTPSNREKQKGAIRKLT
jgi:hypothetical protein